MDLLPMNGTSWLSSMRPGSQGLPVEDLMPRAMHLGTLAFMPLHCNQRSTWFSNSWQAEGSFATRQCHQHIPGDGHCALSLTGCSQGV